MKDNLMPLVMFFISVHTSIVLFQCHVAHCLASWGTWPPCPPQGPDKVRRTEARQEGVKSPPLGGVKNQSRGIRSDDAR